MTLLNPFVSFPAAGGGGDFSPLDLPDLATWFDAADADSFTMGTGTIINVWGDKSGNGLDAARTNSPTRSGSKNGLATVEFDGNARLQTPSFQRATTYSILAVVRDTSAGTDARHIFDSDENGNRQHQFRYSGTDAQLIAFDVAVDTQAVTRANWNLITGIATATTVETWVNGTSDGSTARGGTLANRNTEAVIGAGRAGSTAYSGAWIGDIAEIIYTLSDLSSSDRLAAEDYLTDKWGL